MSEMMWYFVKNGERLGPFSLTQLRQMAAAGLLLPTDRLYRDGDNEGARADSIPDLYGQTPHSPTTDGAAPAVRLASCVSCKARLSGSSEFCPHCGHPQRASEGKVPGERVGTCSVCGTHNVVSTGYGHFSHEACRGCGRSLRETNPEEFLDAEMERVYENSIQGAKPQTVLIALGATVLFWIVASKAGWYTGPTPGKIHPVGFLLSVGAAYILTHAAVSRYIRSVGAWDGWSTRSEMAGQMRGKSWDRTAARYAARGTGSGAGTDNSAGAAGWSPWGRWALAAIVAGGGYYLYQAEFSQYALGRKAGIQHVREMSTKGAFIRAGMNAANMLDLIQTNPDAPPDWNAGFRAGFKEELGRMYPEARRP